MTSRCPPSVVVQIAHLPSTRRPSITSMNISFGCKSRTMLGGPSATYRPTQSSLLNVVLQARRATAARLAQAVRIQRELLRQLVHFAADAVDFDRVVGLVED